MEEYEISFWAKKLSRPQIARPGHKGFGEGCWELPMTSAHWWHAVWLLAWTQHHRCHIHCMPATRNVPCHQQDTAHGLCQTGKGIPSCTQPCNLGSSEVLRSGWCGSYRACMKTRSRVRVGWASYCSSLFWKPSGKSFVQDVPGTPCMQLIVILHWFWYWHLLHMWSVHIIGAWF